MSSQANESTVSLQSTADTVNSSAPLNSRPTKDYAAALGALQSRYGSGGATPSPKMYPSKKLPDTPHASPSTSQTSSSRSEYINAGDSQATLALSSLGSETAGNSESEGSAGPSDTTSKKSKSKKKAGSILKSIFKGKAKET